LGVAVEVEGFCGVGVAGEEGFVVGGEDASAAGAEVDGVGVDVVDDVVEGDEIDVIVWSVEVKD